MPLPKAQVPAQHAATPATRPLAPKRPRRLGALFALLCAAGAGAQSPAVVELARVERGALSETLSLSGSLRAVNDAQLSPRIEGLIATLEVDAGARVEAGAPLLRLDDRLARLEVEALEAESAATAAARDEARRRVDEAVPLVAQRSLPQTELAARRAALAEAEATMNAVRARLAAQRERLDRHLLRAPFTGVVAARLIDVGEWVTPSSPVLQLVDTGALRLEVQVPQERFADIDADTRVEIEPDTQAGTRFAARIDARVPVSGGSGARTFLLQIVPTAVDPALLPGTSARAHFRLSRGAALSIPRDALLRHPDGGYSVFVAKEVEVGLRAQRRPLRLGRESGLRVEIAEGLDEGERVVVRGNENLQDGQAIQVRAAGG
ncbi:efflux RND transporter periplasmic adaptor subunit [Aquimonas voraii]|uniref:RND family efflux transporter, MFP subunit n=1 Tax=Aquimonas voraii TaxID=265719 RepID=A0A1G6UTG6_9GAMM|nr:efflux RND transporter periplasmic adaptor subunit [Aquimonas voraii]SDD44710.1 RND family efflux transporter, MFP subunit [Aquimonas voraii]